MSFPSVATNSAAGMSPTDALLAAVKTDCALAVAFLHRKAHEAKDVGGPVRWSEDPASVLGKQLIRIHASDAVRPLVEQHICHGQLLQFVNCCSGTVGGGKMSFDELIALQIACQDGTIAHADC